MNNHTTARAPHRLSEATAILVSQIDGSIQRESISGQFLKQPARAEPKAPNVPQAAPRAPR